MEVFQTKNLEMTITTNQSGFHECCHICVNVKFRCQRYGETCYVNYVCVWLLYTGSKSKGTIQLNEMFEGTES
jgi:hypothetical protein